VSEPHAFIFIVVTNLFCASSDIWFILFVYVSFLVVTVEFFRAFIPVVRSIFILIPSQMTQSSYL
jgi:hypothetical protein